MNWWTILRLSVVGMARRAPGRAHNDVSKLKLFWLTMEEEHVESKAIYWGIIFRWEESKSWDFRMLNNIEIWGHVYCQLYSQRYSFAVTVLRKKQIRADSDWCLGARDSNSSKSSHSAPILLTRKPDRNHYFLSALNFWSSYLHRTVLIICRNTIDLRPRDEGHLRFYPKKQKSWN